MLTEAQKTLVKNTVPVLREHGIELTSYFYKRMLNNNAELKQIFNRGHQEAGKQQHALATAVLAYAENIDNPTILENAFIHIANKHVSLNIRAEHYPIVGEHLLASISEVLGEAATDDLIEAWGAAYQQLAQLLIDIELGIYKEQIREHAWTGWRGFKIVKKIPESEQITSFYLQPVDGGKLPEFYPGQYVSVRIYVPEWNLIQPRQYTLSDSPGKDTLRITVKREDGKGKTPAGKVSNLLHKNYDVGDIIDLSAPAGEFYLNQQGKNPIILMSAGVGITPMYSMLSFLHEKQSNRSVHFIHGTHNGKQHALREKVNEIVEKSPTFNRFIFYSKPDGEDRQGIDYDYQGRMDINRIDQSIFDKDADYYLCGPVEFMKDEGKKLKEKGIPPEKIHVEAFGTGVFSI